MKNKTVFIIHTKIIGLISILLFRIPILRSLFWARQYNFLANMFNDDFIFMNLGYSDTVEHNAKNQIQNVNDINKLSENLYQFVINDINLNNKDVLEIGCGRGGGALLIDRSYYPKSLTAIDISEKSIMRLQRLYKNKDIIFRQADATNLPFADNSCDVVINIESSHCYSSKKKFLKEVFRVLRSDGYFLYADLISFGADNVSLWCLKKYFSACGFSVKREVDISKNVIESRNILSNSGQFENAMKKWLNSEFQNMESYIINESKKGYYLKGTIPYKLLKSGFISYWCWTLWKE